MTQGWQETQTNWRDCSRRTGKQRLSRTVKPEYVAEHAAIESDIVSGGYGHRQIYELVQNGADALLEAGQGGGSRSSWGHLRFTVPTGRRSTAAGCGRCSCPTCPRKGQSDRSLRAGLQVGPGHLRGTALLQPQPMFSV